MIAKKCDSYTISEIERFSSLYIATIADEHHVVKGHDVYMVDLGGRFGFSALVCADGMHLYYANDYQLHHSTKTVDELRDWYLMTMEHKLFTEEELLAPATSYDEQQRKAHYLHNHYAMRRPRVSIFGDAPKWFAAEKSSMFFSPVGFGWYHDKWFVDHMNELHEGMERATEAMRGNYDYMFKAFVHEMYNHEYPINWQGDWDVINCFTRVDYADEDTAWYLNQTGWNDEVKRAYIDARAKVMHDGEDW